MNTQKNNIQHFLKTQTLSSISNPINCYVILLAAGSGSRMREAFLPKKNPANSQINSIASSQFSTENYSHDEASYKKKQFIQYKNAPLWWQSVVTFHSCPHIKGMVIVFPDDDSYDEIIEDAQKRHTDNNLSIPFYFARGGNMRHHSVFNGLSALPLEKSYFSSHNSPLFCKNFISHILIHDSARPFFSSTLVNNLLETMEQNPQIHALIPAITLHDTIKVIQKSTLEKQNTTKENFTSQTFFSTSNPHKYEIVASTPDRQLLRAVQTPQAFHTIELINAHKKIHSLENEKLKVSLEKNVKKNEISKTYTDNKNLQTDCILQESKHLPPITDDAMIMEFCGHEVFLIDGEEKNVKITSSKDLILLEEKKYPIPCSGYGYDVHSFGGDRPFILGGISIPTDLKIKAHSDGDVLLHALMDALLSCLCLGDIGTHFPDTDKKFENISSSLLLDHVMGLWQKSNLHLCHVDLTIITQKPKIAPFAKEISKNIARLLNISSTCINTKATTEEKLGFTGEGLGIKAIALVSALKTNI